MPFNAQCTTAPIIVARKLKNVLYFVLKISVAAAHDERVTNDHCVYFSAHESSLFTNDSETCTKPFVRSKPDWRHHEVPSTREVNYYESYRALGYLFRSVDLQGPTNYLKASRLHLLEKSGPSRMRDLSHSSASRSEYTGYDSRRSPDRAGTNRRPAHVVCVGDGIHFRDARRFHLVRCPLNGGGRRPRL